ncbi:MAG: hypothetical protein V4506_07100 [Bacteroidota bacterium]
MKTKLFLIFTIILLQTELKAQSFRFGTVAADIGLGGGIYGISGHSPVNNTNVSGIGVVGTLPRINAEFGLLRYFGVGISYRRGTYGKGSAGPIRGSDILFRGNFHLANKSEKFDLVIGAGYGFSKFNGTYSSSQYINAKGGILNIHVTPHMYFGKYVGMFVGLGYNKHLFNKVDIKNGSDYYSEANGATWKMGGVYFEFGVSGHFHIFKKKE